MQARYVVVAGLAGWLAVATGLACSSDRDTIGLPTDDPQGTVDGGGTVSGDGATSAPVDAAPLVRRAVAVMVATDLEPGSPAGSVRFTETAGVVTVTVTIAGAEPSGPHGMHIHAGSSCANDADGGIAGSALGHWNPTESMHGYPDAASRHAGDFGNLEIDDAGAGTMTFTTTAFTLEPGVPNSALNKAVVFHAGTDDGDAQPSGNSGGRASCGIITAQ